MEAAAATHAQPNRPVELVDVPESSQGGQESLEWRTLYGLIEQQPFFKGLNGRQLHMLTDSAMVMRFAPGQAILMEGGPANRFYLILEGKVAFEMELDADGATIPVQTLGPGQELGGSWLFSPYLPHFSAQAMEPTRTIFFYGTRLREQCDQGHEFGY